MRKKAQSEAITVVLIILLVLAAVVIVYQAVRGTVSKTTEAVTQKSSCIGIVVDAVSVTNGTVGKIKITRQTGGADDAVDNIKIIVKGVTATISAPVDKTLKQLETKEYTVGAIASGDKIEIAPTLKDGSQCDVADSIVA